MGIQRRRRRMRPAREADSAVGSAETDSTVASAEADSAVGSGETDSAIGSAQALPPGAARAEGPDPAEPHRPSPSDLAERSVSFALTSAVHDPDPSEAAADDDAPAPADLVSDRTAGGPAAPRERARPHSATADAGRAERPRGDAGWTDPEGFRADLYRVDSDDPHTERGLRGLVGGGSSQVSVTAAMRARDAARPTDDDIATAESQLAIVRRGWVPREDLPRPGRRP